MTTTTSPSPTAANGNGREKGSGRFTAGNSFARGNPHAKRVGELRALILDEMGDADLRDIVRMLMAKAKGGDLMAARELLDRAFGRAQQSATVEVSQGTTGRPDLMRAIATNPELRGRLNRLYDEAAGLAENCAE